MIDPLYASMPYIKAGKIKALAVTNLTRSAIGADNPNGPQNNSSFQRNKNMNRSAERDPAPGRADIVKVCNRRI